MTYQDHEMANLADWLEEKYGSIQAQYVLDQITKMQRKNDPLECLEIMLLADLINGYRKEILRQIKSFKALRKQNSVYSLPILSVVHKLKEKKEQIQCSIECWTTLRDDYFLQRACYMEHCRRFGNSYIAEYAPVYVYKKEYA